MMSYNKNKESPSDYSKGLVRINRVRDTLYSDLELCGTRRVCINRIFFINFKLHNSLVKHIELVTINIDIPC